MPFDPRPLLSAPDDDPWLWLEEVEGPEALEWVAQRNAATLGHFAGLQFERDRDRIRAVLDRPDRIPYVTRRGGLLYNFWRDAAHPRGLWRRTTMAGYQAGADRWDVLLDLDALAREEGEDWVWQGAATLPPEHGRAVLRLSRGGGDAVVLREFDVPARSFVRDGFVLPEAKGGIDWVDQDRVLLVSAHGDGMETRSGYARTVRLWHRGEDPLAASVLFQVPVESMSTWGAVDREAPPDRRIVLGERTGFYDTTTLLGDLSGPKRRLEVPTDATCTWHDGWLAVRPRTPWRVGDREYAPDTVLGIRLDRFLDGARNLQVLFEPGERRALQGVSWAGRNLLLSVLDDLRPSFPVLVPSDGGWTRRELQGLPALGTAAAWRLDESDEESDGTLLATVQDPLTPPSLALIPPSLGAPQVLRTQPPVFDAGGNQVTRHEALSSDGERIPYVQVGPPGETGDAPVHLYGYGGFRVTTLPSYQAIGGPLWLERGGTRVIAQIRGGSEFGTRWHEAGRRERKRLSHDDFAAVADHLVRRGVTRPGRIAAEGGSNGGLLIANMLTRYPERFGALFCTIPLIDMRRYDKLLAGASWVAEYGNPDDPADWAFLGPMSAYHAAEPGRRYPPILLATSRRDDRVHPGHARKMAAKLIALGYEAWFYEPADGGHGYGKNNAEVATFTALGLGFLRQAIGWAPGPEGPGT